MKSSSALPCQSSPLVGQRVGRSTVDRFGDAVMAAAVAGDGYRRRLRGHPCAGEKFGDVQSQTSAAA